jgi:hypothetical protein
MNFQQMWRQRRSCRHICGEYFFNVGHRCSISKSSHKTYSVYICDDPLHLYFYSIFKTPISQDFLSYIHLQAVANYHSVR